MLGDLVRNHRRRLGLTQEDLAARSGVAVRTIRDIEVSRITGPRPGTISLLADALGLVGPVRQELRDAATGLSEAVATPDRPVAPLNVPSQLPATSHFTGRSRHLAELDRLAEAGGDPSAVPIVLITGTAGVGKTALAARWARTAAGRFPDGHLYVNLRGYADLPPLRPIDALARMLTALGVAATDVPVELDDAAGLFRTVTAGRRLLVLLDDVRTAEQVRPLLPGQGPSMVLATSRGQLDGLVAREGAHPVPVGELDPDESVALLARVVGDRRVGAEPAAAAELARLCAHLPLALRIAAAKLLSGPPTTIADYVNVLRDHDRLAELAVADDPQASVRRALDLSYRTLPEPPRRLFRLLALVPGPTVDVGAAAALLGADRVEAGRELSSLTRLHLLTEQPGGRFTWHDLLRLHARERVAAEEATDLCTAALRRLLSHYLWHAAAAAALAYPHSVCPPVAGPAEADGIAPFADARAAAAWLDAERPNLVAAIVATADTGLAPLAWRLADALLGYFWMHRFPTDWLVMAEAALAAARREDDIEGLAGAHLSLGNAYRVLARYTQAVEHLTAAVEHSRRSGASRMECAALGSLAMSCAEIGQLRRAVDLTVRAVELGRSFTGTTAEALQLGIRGNIRISVGELDSAADDLTAALELHRVGGSRVGAAIAITNLGWVNVFRGRTGEAYAQLTAGLAEHGQLNHRLSQALAAAGLGELHATIGDVPAASDHATIAVELAGAVGDRRMRTIAYIVLAHADLVAGDGERARQHARTAADLATEDRNRYLLGEAALTIADACLHQGDIDPAAGHVERSLAVARQDGYRVLEGTALALLAEVQLHRGQPAAAIVTARLGLTEHRRTGYRIRQARTLLVLAAAHHAGAQHAPARAAYDSARRLYTEVGARDADAQLRLVRLFGQTGPRW